ncbi:DUF4134 domain-containing protein [Dyadobacter chenwenxiniae]|nr:DUF4134 domain-containing protein [Dyadobacter chenwenxiniae]
MKRVKSAVICKSKQLFTAILLSLSAMVAKAQDGAAGISEADSQVRSYFEPGTQLMYAIGAVLGLVGAVKVFQKWNAGDNDTGKVAAAWFGSCIFLVVVATVLQSFFGL